MASEPAGEKSGLSLSNFCNLSGVFSAALSESTDRLSVAPSLRIFSGVFSAAFLAVFAWLRARVVAGREAGAGAFAGFFLGAGAELRAAGFFMAETGKEGAGLLPTTLEPEISARACSGAGKPMVV